MEKHINSLSLILILYIVLILFTMIIGLKFHEYRGKMQDLNDRIKDLESPKSLILPFPEGDYAEIVTKPD